MSCAICYDDLTNENTVEYSYDGNEWIVFDNCYECTCANINSIKDRYIKSFLKPDCEKSFKALLKCGMPHLLTIDGNFESNQINYIKVNDEVTEPILKSKLNNDIINAILETINEIKSNYESDDTYDYMGKLKEINDKYKTELEVFS